MSYVGDAVLLDDASAELGHAQVTLATIDPASGSWRGVARGLDPSLFADGGEVTVQLPHGLSGRAKVVIDLTATEPIITLVGIGHGPI